MAPEQAAGGPDADHRADLYAFGVMAYELLAGQPPFRAHAGAAAGRAHGRSAAGVGEPRPDVPAALAELVMRCLAKDPERVRSRPGSGPCPGDRHVQGMPRRCPRHCAAGACRPARRSRLGAATAGVGVTAWAATDVIGLPDWVLPGSLGVMLAGLPVIGITAFVQRTATGCTRPRRSALPAAESRHRARWPRSRSRRARMSPGADLAGRWAALGAFARWSSGSW